MSRRPHPGHARPAVDASMSLLNEVMYHPVEAGYAEAATRPTTRRSPAAQARRSAVHLAVAVALGLLTASAVVSLRTPRPAEIESRTLLQQEIEERSAHADALAVDNEALSAEISTRQADALAAANPTLFAELEEAELLSGAVAVEGPGLVVELDDAEAEDGEELAAESRVQDVDLQIVTNGLWASGAEAIAINGQRLTALSVIRNVGPAILVDLDPLVAPYRVEAIGDVQAVQTAFARTSAAGHLTTLQGTYGIPASIRAAELLTLPGAGNTTLRYADVPDGVASSTPPDEGD